MSELRVALIGFGSWTRSAYLPALEYDGRAVVASVAAPSARTRQLAREALGNEIPVFDNYEALLKDSRYDAIMIAVPDHQHQAALSAALKTGIPVFYEPPIADTREQISSMIDRLLAAPQVTYADLELGFNAVIPRTVNLIENKTIGLLQNVTITLQAAWGREQPDLDLCLINRASCWYLDLLNRIMGSIPRRVLVLDGHGNSGRRQTVSTGVFDYNGIWGLLKMNVNSAERLSINIQISGDEGDIEINLFTGELRSRCLQHPEWTIESCPAMKPYADWPGVRETVSAFLDAVISGDPNSGNARTVAQLNLIGLAADQSKDSRTWVEIKNISCK